MHRMLLKFIDWGAQSIPYIKEGEGHLEFRGIVLASCEGGREGGREGFESEREKTG